MDQTIEDKANINETNPHRKSSELEIVEVINESVPRKTSKYINNTITQKDLTAVVKYLLNLQCIFLVEKEILDLKNRKILKNVNKYIKSTTSSINIHKLLLIVVKEFTEKYFEDVRHRLTIVLDNISSTLGGGDVNRGTQLLNNCLVILEKRMFENMCHELESEPFYFTMIFNKFGLDVVENEEMFRIEFIDNILKCTAETGFNSINTCKIKYINIYDLIKYVYYNAVISAKKTISNKIFKRFLEENFIEDVRKGKLDEDQCEKYKTRNPTNIEEKTNNDVNDKLRVVEYLIKQFWNHLPDLKNPITLKSDTFQNQIRDLIDFEKPCSLKSKYEDETEDDKITDWNYLVTRDGDTLYLNVPTYKYVDHFLPGLIRRPEGKLTLSESEFEQKITKGKIKKCGKPDLFDLKLDKILKRGRVLVGNTLGPDEKLNKTDEIMNYIKIRNNYKKQQILKSELWEQFEKKYFTFEDVDSYDTNQKCSYPLRPNEFYDQVPTYMKGKVQPIEYEFEKARYICAACGMFINKGSGLEALGYKWHVEHFKCRICCESFTKSEDFLLYRGVIFCLYDAEIILNLTVDGVLCKDKYW